VFYVNVFLGSSSRTPYIPKWGRDKLPLEDDNDSVLEFVGDGEGVVNSSFLGFSSSSRKGKKSYFFFFLLSSPIPKVFFIKLHISTNYNFARIWIVKLVAFRT
jgi:hypothetical protein